MQNCIPIALVLVAATAAGTAMGASPGAAKPPAPSAATTTDRPELTPASLRTDGLHFGDDLTRIFVGDFAHLETTRNGTVLSILVSQYMTTFSRQCAGDLPPDKVEIMTQECTRESWTVNGYGVEQPGSRHCTSYRTVGTGRYADPEVHKLHTQLDAAMSREMMGGMLGAMKKGGDPSGGIRQMTDVAIYARNDMPKLLQANGCASPALKRLQANLVRFGQGKDPITMPGAAAALAAKVPATEGLRKEQNHLRLLDDLITEQSQAWMMNRYQPGSVRPGTTARDAQGHAREVVAGYSYQSMGKSYAGKVRLTFADGVPQCLYFADLPDACRAPSPRLVSAYRKNHYAEDRGHDQATRAAPAAPAVPVATRPADVALPAPASPAARPEAPEEPAPPVAAAASAPALAPEATPPTVTRDLAPDARAAALQDRQAAARQRQCAALRSSIDRARESLANGAPQRAQRAEPQFARMELHYTQQCGR